MGKINQSFKLYGQRLLIKKMRNLKINAEKIEFKLETKLEENLFK